MDYMEFAGCMRALMEEELGKGYSVSVAHTEKNNGVERTGIMVDGGQRKARPCIYMEGFYQMYTEMGVPLEELAAQACRQYMEDGLRDFDSSRIMEWDRVKDSIFCMLVSTELNRGRLEERPRRDFLDLSVVYYARAGLARGEGIIPVTAELAGLWGKTEEELYSQALADMRMEGGYICRTLEEATQGFGTGQEEAVGAVPMYVLGREDGFYGAAGLLLRENLRTAAGKAGGDCIILPSSVHEVLLVPAAGEGEDYSRYAEMVKDVNDRVVARGEILSYHVYRYDAASEEISIVA